MLSMNCLHHKFYKTHDSLSNFDLQNLDKIHQNKDRCHLTEVLSNHYRFGISSDLNYTLNSFYRNLCRHLLK